MRVVATAGHVDHGKSSLVLALTGTDPDRWPQEKARGLTIDLGFAFTTLGSGTELGFVDVPGHVRFLKNMLAGVGAVEAALLVVAATEGWMPQSEEHLRILDLLGVTHGLVAISKADLVDDDLLDLARLEVEEHLEGAAFVPADILAVDSRSGRGLPELRAALDDMLAATPAAADRGRPRLWVDRVFAAKGAGTVVTGTMAGGRFALEDEVVVVPAGGPGASPGVTGRRARVRHIESHYRELAEAAPGGRVALNLAGVDHHQLARGQAVVLPGQWAVTTTADVLLRPLPGVAFVRRGAFKAYVGSGEHEVRLRVLDAGDDDSPAFARLHFAGPVPLEPGDRLVLRESGSQTTVGGAEVLDVAPTGRARLAPGRLRLPLAERLLAGRPWLRPADVVPLAGVDGAGAAKLVQGLVKAGAAVPLGRAEGGGPGGAGAAALVVDKQLLTGLRAGARDRLAAHHREAPLEPGLELPLLAAALKVDPARLKDVLDGVKGIVVEQGRARLESHLGVVAGRPEAKAVLAALSVDPFSPPSPADTGAPPEIVRGLLREGLLVDLDGVVLTAEALEQARALVSEALLKEGSLTVAQARDLLGSSRKYVLAILNRLDAEGVTRRQGDDRLAGPRVVSQPGR